MHRLQKVDYPFVAVYIRQILTDFLYFYRRKDY